MKKTVFMLAFCLIAFIATAQDPTVTSNNGNPVLPERGDIAIDIDASPFLTYAGRLFTQGNVAPSVMLDATNPLNLTARYFTSSTNALRLSAQIGHSSNTTKNIVSTNPDEFSSATITSYRYGLGAGYEWSKYRGRIRVLYGGEVFTTFGSLNNTNFVHPTDTGTSWKTTGANTFQLGVQGIFGGEYYFAPKMAVGATLNFGLFYNSNTPLQRQQGTANPVTISGSSSGFGFDNAPRGSIRFSFLF